MGFDYSHMYKLDKYKHFFIGGNHDNMEEYYKCPNNLGDYGVYNFNNISFFVMRGAMSIDCLMRLKDYQLSGNKTWWHNEELNIEEFERCISLYKTVKPDFIVTHDCPVDVKNILSNPEIMKRHGWPVNHNSNTQMALQVMLDEHRPKLWVFGHHHKNFDRTINGTRFICLPELGYIDVSLINGEYKIK
jgi:predicted phosphohydrolase